MDICLSDVISSKPVMTLRHSVILRQFCYQDVGNFKNTNFKKSFVRYRQMCSQREQKKVISKRILNLEYKLWDLTAIRHTLLWTQALSTTSQCNCARNSLFGCEPLRIWLQRCNRLAIDSQTSDSEGNNGFRRL